MAFLLGVLVFLSLAGLIYNVAAGIMEDRVAAMYYAQSDPIYFKRATFFAFLFIVFLAMLLNALNR